MARTSEYRGFRFQFLDHDALMRNDAFSLLPIADHGVYMQLRLQAGRTRQDIGSTDGTIAFGAERKAKRKTIVAWMAQKFPDMTSKKAEAALKRLQAAGVILITRAGVVRIADWHVEQTAAPSAQADRKRKHREKKAREIFFEILSDKRGDYVSRDDVCNLMLSRVNGGRKFALHFLDECTQRGFLRAIDENTYRVEMVGTPENIDDSSCSPCPAPPSSSTFEGVTIHNPPGVTSHKTKIEKDINISSSSISRNFVSGGGAGQGEQELRMGSVDLQGEGADVYAGIYLDDPIEAALVTLRIVENRAHNRNSLQKLWDTLLDAYHRQRPESLSVWRHGLEYVAGRMKNERIGRPAGLFTKHMKIVLEAAWKKAG